MKKKMIGAVAAVLTVIALFGGVFLWQYLNRRTTFKSDGYMIASEEQTDTVVCNYFTSGSAYSKTYGDEIMFVNSMGTKERMRTRSFIHYTDTSLSSLQAAMLADLDEAESGVLDFYYLAPKMVLTGTENTYAIDNNGTNLEFRNFLYLLDEGKFMVQSGGGMTLKLASGASHELESGYLEITYPEDRIVQIYNEESLWQSIADGCLLVLDNGVTIDLGNKTILDSQGNTKFTIDDVAMDLASGSGIAVQSDSDVNWEPPVFEFDVIDGSDGVNGENGVEGVAGTNGEEGSGGEAGEDKEDGEDGEEGEEGEEGDEGDDGDDGRTGNAGTNGTKGQSGTKGTSGTSGDNGQQGADGSNGGTAGGGGGGSGSMGNGIGHIVISELEYDCSEVTFSFYADDAEALQPGNDYVEIIDLATSTVRRIDAENAGDNNTSLNRDIVDTDKENPIELTVQGLNADTEYQIVIYSGYSVMNAENVATGTKAFATRTFYTASEGVTMSVSSRSQSSVTISLERKNFSKVEKARVYLTFEGSNGQGSSVIKTLWKDVTFGNSGKGEVTFDAIEDGESLVGGLTSNIPFYATLYTGPDESSLWTHSNGEDDETTLIPDGALLENRKVIKSNQKLDGRTLKATPNFGEVAFFKNSNGSYQIYLDGVADPDNATENYVYKIYAFDEDKSEKVLVRTLSTITNSGVELFVDEDGGNGTVKFNGDYIVECEASYYDNEKNYTALLSGTLKTGSGESIVWFMPADNPNTFPWSLPDYVKGQGAVGPTWMYGYLVIDGSKTAFSIDKAKDITVQASSGDDYTVSMLFSGWDDTEVNITDIQQFDPGAEDKMTEKGLRVYSKDQNMLFLPVNLWGLKAGSYYTFTVSATVEYSDALKAVRGVGTTIVKSGDYNKSDIDKDKDTPSNQLHFRIDDIHTTVPDYGKLAFAIKLEDDWKDSGNYPIEVLSARAIEVAISDKNHQLVDTHIFDLYEEYTVDPEDEMVWCTDKSPLMQYFKRSETEKEEPLLIYKTDMFNGSVDAYDGRMYFEITNVYDYTYKNPSAPQYFQTVSASNRNFKNNLAFDGKEAFSDIGREKPKLIDPPTDGVAFQPILNKVDVSPEKGEVSINQVLGPNSCDPGLDGDVVRGYCLQANYKSSEIDAITYYLFTYDDWRYFSKCIVESEHGVNNNLEDRNDIVRASLLAEKDENKNQPIEFWKDKVLKIELKQKDFEDPFKWYTEAPNIAVVYDPNAEGENGYEMEEKTVGSNDWIIIRTNFLSRGRTYIASFSVMDGYGERDENGNATYWYPFDDLEYPRSNLSLFRSYPMKMNRQAPQVKMLLNKTDLAGDQEWEVYVYDPDQALGRIQLGSENEKDYNLFCNKLTTWDDMRKENNAKWREGYIMASTYSKNTGVSCAIKSYAADYKTGTEAFPEVKEIGGWKDSADDSRLLDKLTSIFGDYSARGGDNDVNLKDKGKMWYGKFDLGMGGNPAGKYYLFLGRSLNDSMYLTTPKDNTAGGEGRSKNDLTLYTMAASTYAYQTLVSDEDVKSNARFTVTNDKNNLSFSFDPQKSNEKKRAVALEVTIWQNTNPNPDPARPELDDYDILVSEIIACDPESNGVAAAETFGDLDNLKTSAQAYATARIIYDTGLYGTAQNSDGIQNANPTATLKKNGGTINLWKNKGEIKNTYSLRRQADETWYSGGGGAIGAATNKITNSLWKINTSTFHGLSDSLPATADMTILHGESDNDGTVNNAYRPFDLALTSQYAKGDDYISEDDMLQHAVSGWNYGTTGSIVFGRLGVTNVEFAAYEANEKPISDTVTLYRQGNKDPIVLNKGEAVGFILGQPEIAVSRDSDTTITPYLNKAEVKFRLEEASKNRIYKGEEYLPYVFIEVYEGTKVIDFKPPENVGTLVEKIDWTKESYRKGPASIYNELWGAAKEEGSVFENAAAIRIGEKDIQKGAMTQFMLSNLKILGETDVTYSVKLYVLPKKDSLGKPIIYGNMTSPDQFEAYKQPIKDYSYDKNKGKAGKDFYCSNVVGSETWWKLPTIVPPAMKTVSVTYTPGDYDHKNLNISQITEFTSNLTKDAYLEAQLLDASGKIILTNKQIKGLAGYDQANFRTFEYYDGDGQKKTRYFADYGGTGNNYYVNGGMNINIIDEINSDTTVSNKLRPGEKYTIQMRLCYMDPTLALLNPKYFEKKSGGSWLAEGDRSTVSGKESRTDFDVHLTAEDYKNPIAEGTVAIAIGEAIVPFVTGDFGAMSEDGQKQDMTIRPSISDVSYTLGAFKQVTTPEGSTKTELVRGDFYVKVYDYNNGVALDVTDQFPRFATHLSAKDKLLEGTWKDKNPNFGHSYYVEYWGTINGISHQRSGLCGCGKQHVAGEVDADGNERLWTTKGDTYFDANLTMPDASGIKISTITGKCTTSGSDTLVEVRIMGSGYKVLEGSTCRIDISTNSGLVRIQNVSVSTQEKTVGSQKVIYFTTAGISAADKALLQSWGTASMSIEFTYQGGKKYTIAGGFSY